MGNTGSLDPRRWMVKVRAAFSKEEASTQVELEWSVTTFGQIVTKPDIAYWSKEVEMSLVALLGGRPDAKDLMKVGVQTYKGNVWRASLFAIALGVPLFGLWYASGSLWVGLLAGTIVGSATWVALKAPRRLDVALPTPPPPPNELQPPTA